MPTTRIIFGPGYLGLRVGQLWKAAGDHTWAFSRNKKRVLEIGMAGLLPALGDVTQPQSLERLREHDDAESLLFTIGYDRNSGHAIHTVYADGLRNVLASLPATVTRAIYISTTGVYGSAGGEWVDERTPPAPSRDGGKASLAAERILAQHPLGRRSAVLRLAGIYGPGRIPYLDKLRNGQPLPVPTAGWLNLIHVDDAARITVAVDTWLKSQPGGNGPHVFCVSDGVPVARREYYAEVARLIGTPGPAFSTPAPDSPAAARAAADRRVCNAKLMQTLEIKLDYPNYREGLAAILAPPTSS